MRKGLKRASQKDISRATNSIFQSTQSTQHGQHSSPLYLLPAESLTHITSFLDPVSLHSLAQTSWKLYEHVSDDNTWRRAFFCQFLGVSPENALKGFKALTFRLTQKTWKQEFVNRHIIRRLWLRSKNAAISHLPCRAPISLIHVMADHALLSANTQYAIVARSFPLRNKVLKGCLYGTGEPPGMGDGFPNTNLMPNISACALASDGTTAKVIWGRQDGSVVFVSHPRTMSGTQAPASVHTSSVRQEHEGAVLDGAWAASDDAFVTAGSDGRVKVWTVAPFRCTWTSERHLSGREIDPISKVVEDLANGLIVAASGNGDIILFSGFDAPFEDAAEASRHDIQKLCIPARNLPIPDVEEPGLGPQPMKISALFLQASSPTSLSILAFYPNTSWFFRCSVDLLSERVDVKAFGNAAFGIIRCIQPAFSNNPVEPSFVLAGTQLGVISIYDWDSSLSNDPIPFSRHVDVFSDAHVTSLAMNPFVIIAGSSRGTIMVLDILTLETLRSFAVSTPNEVRQIELAGDVLVANVGSEVLAWSTGHFRSGGKKSVKIKGKGKQGGHGKWYKQIELGNDMAETAYPAEEPFSLQSSLGPKREQMMQLHTLGLTELEAVEYTLMLSRDEELQRLRNSTDEYVGEEGIFDADESSNSQSGSDQSTSSSSSVRQYSPPPLRPSTSGSSTGSHGNLVPLASPSSSNIKVQVSPRFYPEPMEAGGLSGSPCDSQPVPQGNPSYFLSSSYSQSALGPTNPPATPSKQGLGGIGASSGKPNAWNKPLPGTGLAASPPFPPRRDWEVEAESIRQVEDLELRLALELSLAEARCRERNVGGT